MIKKDKDRLLTVTERNKLKFAQGVDRVNNNILDAKNTSYLNKYYPQWSTEYLQSIIKPFNSNGYSPSSWGLNTFWSPQLNYSYSPAPLTAKDIFSATKTSPQSSVQVSTEAPNYWENVPSSPKIWNYYDGTTFRPYSQDILNNPTATITPDKVGNVLGNLPSITDTKAAADNIVSNNPLTKDMIKGGTTPVKKPGFNWKAAAPAIGSGVGMIGNHVISDGFNTETGTAIANAGNMIGQAVGMTNPILGGIISAGSGLLSGFWNRGFGVDVDKKKKAAVEDNIAAAINTGNALAQASDNQTVVNLAGNMVNGVNTKVARNGLFNHSGDKINKGYENAQNSALAYQTHGLITGAKKADKNLDEIAQYNTIAFGGPLDSLMYNNNNMGAIDYDFMSRNLAIKEKQADMKNKMPGITGMPNNMFVLGGPEDIYPVEQNDATRVERRLPNEKITTPISKADYSMANVYFDKKGSPYTKDGYGNNIPISKKEAREKALKYIARKNKEKATDALSSQLGIRPSDAINVFGNNYALGGDVQTHGADYSIGQVYDVTEEEANRLKAMGYEFKIVN